MEPHSPSPSALRQDRTHQQPQQPLHDPQQQPPTKRDIRRNRITEKLQKLIDSFSSNQQAHYRAQLQALQVDMTLVLRADPYSNCPGRDAEEEGSMPGETSGPGGPGGILNEDGEEMRRLIEEIGAGVVPEDTPEGARRDFDAMAGRGYREFVRSVSDCVEQRDAELVALHNRYTSSLTELESLTSFRLRQAEEEHKALTSTIRSRLQQTITKKRQQLLRDKEQLDIADSNALLLHPNHFSINNPGSPPNGLNRKTRHLRHRQGSPNPGDIEAGGNGKGLKKRKALALEDDGNESPAPNMRAAHTEALGSRSPFREAREKNVYAQYEAPAYSLERIFTEKELAMATDTAKIATWRYFNQPQQQEQQASQEQDANGLGIGGDEVMEGIESPTGAGDDEVVVGGVAQTTEQVDGTSPPPRPAEPSAPAAAEMERSTSHQVLTRGGAKANPLAALNDLAALATSERAAGGGAGAGGLGLGLTTSKDPFAPVVPSYHAVTRSEKSGAPAPSGVSHADLDNDFAMMRQAVSHHAPRTANHHSELDDSPSRGPSGRVNEDDEEVAARMRRELLDQALGEQGVSAPYRLPLMETGPAIIGKGVERVPGTGFAPVMNFVRTAPATTGAMASALRSRDLAVGAEPMSRTTSAGGNGSEMEGVLTGTGTGPGTRRGRGRLMV